MKYTPPPGSIDPDAKYVTGNPITRVKGSPVPAEAVENPQREIVEVIKAAGIEPSNADLTQLLQALTILYERNLSPNDEIIITESGDWEVPESGLYHVTIIGGGNGALGTLKDLTNRYQELSAEGGDSGGCEEAFRYYEKGQVIPVVIGAGGIGQILVGDASVSPTITGGKTSFDDITTKTSWESGNRCMLGERNFAYNAWHIGAVGGGIGAGQRSNSQSLANGQRPGAGGGVYVTTPPSSYRVAGNGHDGAVILRFFNREKMNPEQEEEPEEGE